MHCFSHEDLLNMEKPRRTALMNGLSGFRSAVLVGTANQQGVPNLAMFFSTIHIGANPPLMGLLLRPPAARQHTRDNLFATRQFTINAVSAKFYRQAHATEQRLPAEESEFVACGLTPNYWPDFLAPAVAESPIRIGLQLQEHYDIASNQTTLVIGSVQHVEIESELLGDDGHLRPDRARLVCVGDLETYYEPQHVERIANIRHQ